jgi:carnitine-CoA ligase
VIGRVPTQSALERLSSLAETHPDGVLVRCLDTGIDYSHARMLDDVRDWAAAFRGLGVEPGTVVSVMLPLCMDAYFAWLAIAWLRGIEVPVNTDYRGPVLAHVLASSQSEVAVVHSRYLDRFVRIAGEVPYIRTLLVVDDGEIPGILPWNVVRREQFFAGSRSIDATDAPGSADIAAVVYTSGTTGPSKGVVVPWQELNCYTPCWPPDISGPGFCLYSPWPTFHVNGKFALVETLNRGGRVVVRERWRTEQFWDDVRANGVTAAVILGGVSHFLWSQPETDRDADNPLEHVMMAPVHPEFREFEKRFGLKVHTGFASSEAGQPCYAFHPLPNHKTCGRLAPEYEIRLVDADGREVGPNEMGEALVRSSERDFMSRGYWKMPDATERAWADGWFRTGDGLMRDIDGYFYYVDRVKDSLRRRGENISSWELESLVNGCTGVMESAAVAVPGDSGDVDDEILVVVVLEPGAAVQPEQLLAEMLPRTPRFMVPRYIRFTTGLPRTHTGRIRKVELREDGITADTWDRIRAGITLAR